MTESELINNILNGDKSLFSVLVNKYQKQVINICLGFVHDKSKAEDIAQEVFIEIWKSLKKFKQQSKFSTWVYRISVNKSLNFIRKEKKHSGSDIISISNFKNENEIEANNNYNSDFESENTERKRIIWAAINKLSDKQKTVFVLNKYNDVSYNEISEITGYSLSSVESLIHRAKLKLQKELFNFYKKK